MSNTRRPIHVPSDFFSLTTPSVPRAQKQILPAKFSPASGFTQLFRNDRSGDEILSSPLVLPDQHTVTVVDQLDFNASCERFDDAGGRATYSRPNATPLSDAVFSQGAGAMPARTADGRIDHPAELDRPDIPLQHGRRDGRRHAGRHQPRGRRRRVHDRAAQGGAVMAGGVRGLVPNAPAVETAVRVTPAKPNRPRPIIATVDTSGTAAT